MTAISLLLLSMLPALQSVAVEPPPELTIVHETTLASASTGVGLTRSVTVKAVLPNGSHALLVCDSIEEACREVQMLPPEKLPPVEQSCSTTGPNVDGTVTTRCEFKDVGTFRFNRSGDLVTIFHRKGKTRFRVTSSW
jgi:hypothetical protein